MKIKNHRRKWVNKFAVHNDSLPIISIRLGIFLYENSGDFLQFKIKSSYEKINTYFLKIYKTAVYLRPIQVNCTNVKCALGA